MAQDNQPQAVYRNIDKQTMYATIEGSARKARLVWSLRDLNPRISVYPNTGDRDAKIMVINAPMNPNGVQALLVKIMAIAQGPNGKKMSMKCDTSRSTDSGQREMVHAADIWFGKDDDGIVWISVRSPGRPDVVFNYGIDEYMHFILQDGSPMPKSDASVLEAMVACRSLARTYEDFCNQPTVPQPYQGAARTGGYNSNNNSGGNKGNGGGGNRSSGPMDFDDISL